MVLVKAIVASTQAIAAFTSAIPARYCLGSKDINQDYRLDEPSDRVVHLSGEKNLLDRRGVS